MIKAYLQNINEVLIDFGQVVSNFGVSHGAFTINNSFVGQALSFSQDQFALLSLGQGALPQGELWLTYAAGTAGAQIIALSTGVSIKSFEVLVLETNTQESPQVYNLGNTSQGPTLGDFIEAYGLREAIEISNPGSSSATAPDELKFIRAFEDAEALWVSELVNASAASLLVLSPGKRRSILTIARYFLDSACPREFVIKAYEEVIRNLRATVSGISNPETVYTGGDADFFYYEDQHCGGCGGCGVGNARPGIMPDVWLR
jgi:phage gp36-like protein